MMRNLTRILLLSVFALVFAAAARAQDAPLWPAEREVITPENASWLTLFADLDMPHGTTMASGTEVTFTPDGSKLIASRVWHQGQWESIRIWDVASGALLHALDRRPARANSRLLLSPNGLAVVSVVFDGQIQLSLLDVETGQEHRWNFAFPSHDENCEVRGSVSGLT
jgi:WD40 repeat protein